MVNLSPFFKFSGSAVRHFLRNSHLVRSLTLAAACVALPAQAIDLQPGDIKAPPPGLGLFMLTWQQSERGDVYRDGKRDPMLKDSRLLAEQWQVRAGHSFELADMPGFFYAQVPVGSVEPKGTLDRFGLRGNSGVGDTTFLFALWPYVDRERDEYLAVGTYLTLPTGSYDSRRDFNIGSNRTSVALQAGYQRQLARRLSWAAALDGVAFSSNDDYRSPPAELQPERKLEQKALYTAQTSLRYEFGPRYAIGAAYFYTWGGETRLDGRSQDNETRLSRYQLTGLVNFPFGRITVHYGADLRTENGAFEDQRWLLRYTTFF